jgi:hypothetical protein
LLGKEKVKRKKADARRLPSHGGSQSGKKQTLKKKFAYSLFPVPYSLFPFLTDN